ncbi:hypothetical protein [Cerasicoccus frondis]|uniref:hypothetical protein n=1 Tax=Cerasicoccus frondis TaxID=490090 RepID=UPI0028526761|nr:hypothetical protein [Cerasicoccus frondis]
MSTPVTIIRHPKERLSKCSLEPLRGRPDLEFFKATDHFTFDATGYLLLAIDAPEISPADAGKPLLLLDSTWRLLPQLMDKVHGEPILRTLPMHVRTAYPRVSKIAEDPARGLASVEALYLAKKLLGEDDPSLLEHYHWRNDFLRQFG